MIYKRFLELEIFFHTIYILTLFIIIIIILNVRATIFMALWMEINMHFLWLDFQK